MQKNRFLLKKIKSTESAQLCTKDKIASNLKEILPSCLMNCTSMSCPIIVRRLRTFDTNILPWRRAGQSVLGIGIPVFYRYYRKWKISTGYQNTDLFKKIPITWYWKWSCLLPVSVFLVEKIYFLGFLWLFKLFFFSTDIKKPTTDYWLPTFWKFYRILDTRSW